MGLPKPFASRHYEVTRLEGFSDAVFGFAVTLLVVSLEVPRTFDELWSVMRGVIAFAICFAMLFQVWWRHHAYFRRYGLEDNTTKALTGVLLFVVLLYVYPLKFLWTLVVSGILFRDDMVRLADGRLVPMISTWQAPRLFEIYGLGIAAVFGVFVLLYRHAYRHREALALTPYEALLTRLSIMSNAGVASVGVLSVAIAFVGGVRWSGVAGYSYCLIGVVETVIGRYGARAAGRLEGPEAVAS
jgi:uncharacterized membrane protein